MLLLTRVAHLEEETREMIRTAGMVGLHTLKGILVRVVAYKKKSNTACMAYKTSTLHCAHQQHN